MVSSSLALLYFLLGFHGGRQGSSPDRGRSPVEWGDLTSVHTYVPPLGHPAKPEAQPARLEAQPAIPEAQPARSEAQPARSEAQPAGLLRATIQLLNNFVSLTIQFFCLH